MSKIITVHSFRRGTGKSNMVANIATLLAMEGGRVGIIDTNLQSPSVNVLFGLDETVIPYTFNDYLWGKCTIAQAAADVTPHLSGQLKGQVFVVMASSQISHIIRILREGYESSKLRDSYYELVEALNLDVLLIDTDAGLNEENLISISASDSLVVMLHTDLQDYIGTNVILEVARKLNPIPITLIVNETPAIFDFASVKSQLEQTFNCSVAAVLPHSSVFMALGSADIFALRYPKHLITAELKQIATQLIKL